MKESQRDVKKSPKNGKNHGKKKQILIVTTILLIILGANLGIYFNYKKNIQTNYFSLPKEQDSAFYKELYVFIALEKKIEKEDISENDRFFRISIMENKTHENYFTNFRYWKLNSTDGKHLYYANFTFIQRYSSIYDEFELNKTYRFYVHFRAWFSPHFEYINQSGGYFEWI